MILLDKTGKNHYTTNRRGADCIGPAFHPASQKIDRSAGNWGGQSFLLSSSFFWENFAMTSTVRRITSTIRLNRVRTNVSSARVSKRVIRHPSLRLQGSGQGTSKKKFPPGTSASFYVIIEESAMRDGKHDHRYAISASSPV